MRDISNGQKKNNQEQSVEEPFEKSMSRFGGPAHEEKKTSLYKNHFKGNCIEALWNSSVLFYKIWKKKEKYHPKIGLGIRLICLYVVERWRP